MLTGANTPFAFNYANLKADNLQELANYCEPGMVFLFPGGTSANYYDISEPGYGQKVGNGYRAEVHPENAIHDFIAFMRLVPGAKCILRLNLFRHCKSGTITGFQNTILPYYTLLEAGIPVVAVAMGNECYQYPEIVGTTGNITRANIAYCKGKINKYIDFVKVFSSLCRERDPGVIIAIPTGSAKNKKHLTYNNMVVPFCDAIEPHAYAITPELLRAVFADKIGGWKHPGKKIIVGECGFEFGDTDNPKNLSLYDTPGHHYFLESAPDVAREFDIWILCRQSLCQDYSSPYPIIGYKDGKLIKKF